MALSDRITQLFSTPTTAPEDYDPTDTWVPPTLSAAATTQHTPQPVRDTPQQQTWQDKAWQYYRTSGPARQAVDWLANGLSRMHLFIGEVRQDGSGDPEPADDPGQAAELLAEICDGQVGQRDMLHKLGVNIQVAGEAWLIGYPAPPKPGLLDTDIPSDPGTAWLVVSRAEWSLSTTEGLIRVKIPRHPQQDRDGFVAFGWDQVAIVPIYQPDPEDATRSTSRFEAAMKDLDELDGLSRRTAADIRSRLAGAGLLLLPESATMPNAALSESDGANPLHGNPLIHGLMDAASRAIQDPDSPSALIPVTAQYADEAIAKTQHVDLSTKFDEQVPTLRDAARKAVAASMDVPATVVTGIEELSHWSAWAASEDAVKTHLGPLASLICTTITRDILWPALRAAGDPNPERLTVWWDASEVVLRPDRSTEALNAYKQGIIGGAAARRELGFSEDDAPDPAEQPAAPSGPGGSDALAEELGMTESGGQPTPGARPNPPAEDPAGLLGE